MKFTTSFRFLSMLTAAAVALSLVSAAQAAGWLDNFNDGDAEDGSPVTWTYNEVGFTPGIYDASSGDYSLSNPGTSDGDQLVPTVDVGFGDTYVRTQALIVPDPNDPENNFGGNVGVVARWDPFSLSGYAGIIDAGNWMALLTVDGAPVGGVELEPVPFDATTDVMVELAAVGDQISLTVWYPGDPKPAAQLTMTDATYATGRAGLVYAEDDDNTAGLYRWATARDVPIFEADFNFDGKVDGDDFLIWQAGFGVDDGGDTDYDGDTDGDDFLTWQAQFGNGGGGGSTAVPEPASGVLIALLAICAAPLRRRRG